MGPPLLRHIFEPFADIAVIRACPSGTRAFTDYDGFINCCQGKVSGQKCEGSVVCSLSTNNPDVPACRADGTFMFELNEPRLGRQGLVLMTRPDEKEYPNISLMDYRAYKDAGKPFQDSYKKELMTWKFDSANRIENQGMKGQCLDNFAGEKDLVTSVIQNKCDEGKPQKYRYWPSTGQIESLQIPGKCATVTSRSRCLNYKVATWNQIWENSYLTLQDCGDVIGQHFKVISPSV